MQKNNYIKITIAALAVAILAITGYCIVYSNYKNKICIRVQGQLDEDGICNTKITKKYMDLSSEATKNPSETLTEVYNSNKGTRGAYKEFSCDVDEVITDATRFKTATIKGECGNTVLLPDVPMEITVQNANTDDQIVFEACLKNGGAIVKQKGTNHVFCEMSDTETRRIIEKGDKADVLVKNIIDRIYGQMAVNQHCAPEYKADKLMAGSNNNIIRCRPVQIVVNTITAEDAAREAELRQIKRKEEEQRKLDKQFNKCVEECEKQGMVPAYSRDKITPNDTQCGGCAKPVSKNTFKDIMDKLAVMINSNQNVRSI